MSDTDTERPIETQTERQTETQTDVRNETQTFVGGTLDMSRQVHNCAEARCLVCVVALSLSFVCRVGTLSQL